MPERAKRRLVAGLLAFAFVMPACGYRAMVPGARLPADLRTLYVAPVEGQESDPRVRDELAREIRRIVRARGRFSLAPSATEADASLRVSLNGVLTRPVAFDRDDEVLAYETTMRVDAALEEDDGIILWRARGIESTRSHATSPGAVVASSSAFQSSERIELGDLEQFANAQFGESRRRHAYRSIAADLADVIYGRMMEGR